MYYMKPLDVEINKIPERVKAGIDWLISVKGVEVLNTVNFEILDMACSDTCLLEQTDLWGYKYMSRKWQVKHGFMFPLKLGRKWAKVNAYYVALNYEVIKQVSAIRQGSREC